MERAAIDVLMLFVLLPVVLSANPYRRFLKDASFCQERDAACKMSSGNYGCCPATDGVCCADGDHCCPSGFKCDLSAKQCLQYGEPAKPSDPAATPALTEDMLRVVPIGAKAVREVIKGVTIEKIVYPMEQVKPLRGDVGEVDCPGSGGGYCDNGNTCCLGTDNVYTCCPIPSGNCCDDYIHCCPSGTVCDTANSNCITPRLRVLDKIPFLVKTLAGTRKP